MSEERRIGDNEGLIGETAVAATPTNLIADTPATAPLPTHANALHDYAAARLTPLPLVDLEMPSPDRPATAYMTKCYVCGEEITADCYANLRYICPHCRDAIKWLKNHISMLEIILNKEWR